MRPRSKTQQKGATTKNRADRIREQLKHPLHDLLQLRNRRHEMRTQPATRATALSSLCALFSPYPLIQHTETCTEQKAELKNSSISPRYDRNKVSIVFLKGKRLKNRNFQMAPSRPYR